jgi:hypothetical protein
MQTPDIDAATFSSDVGEIEDGANIGAGMPTRPAGSGEQKMLLR